MKAFKVYVAFDLAGSTSACQSLTLDLFSPLNKTRGVECIADLIRLWPQPHVGSHPAQLWSVWHHSVETFKKCACPEQI